jgi:hypothetical protein
MMIRVAENLIFDPDQLKPDAIDTGLSIHVLYTCVLYVTSQYSHHPVECNLQPSYIVFFTTGGKHAVGLK